MNRHKPPTKAQKAETRNGQDAAFQNALAGTMLKDATG
jgi:hypothetical protein